jgi:probable F420-dependent oxidoreductase
MKAGILTFPTSRSIPVTELAVATEERGFDSLWLPEHSHIPVVSSAWPGGDTIPEHYAGVFDPIASLGAAAAVTTTLRLGTGVLLVVQRDPIQLAKSLATLDVISAGRLEIGVGAGWNLAEMINHGTDPGRRFRLLRERVEAMKAIWTRDEAEYHGELVDFDPIRAWPKPVQRPYPRIHVGGAAPGVFKRVVGYGDGWIPLNGRGDSDFPRLARTLRAQLAAAGRDPDQVQVTVSNAPTDLHALEQLAEANIDRVVFSLASVPADASVRRLDELHGVMSQLGGPSVL